LADFRSVMLRNSGLGANLDGEQKPKLQSGSSLAKSTQGAELNGRRKKEESAC
jgi:hypothetical protein